MNYYNEFDPYAAQWLRNLIQAGHIPNGDVDDRDIRDVTPSDIAGYTQCHFFAGIGGWPLALRLAGWPEDREIWTGSCPCQPFSVAGSGAGQDDPRHLWPDFLRLIRAIRPDVVMGEQVYAAIGKGWLDGVFADLEGADYSCGAIGVPACAVNAPHRRDRLLFVADSNDEGSQRHRGSLEVHDEEGRQDQDGCSAESGVRFMGNTDPMRIAQQEGRIAEQRGRAGNTGAWSSFDWLTGHDGKARRVKPGVHLLAHGVPARVGKLRGYGNAIVPQAAAEIIKAYMETTE